MRKLLLYAVLVLTAGCMMLGCNPVGKSFIKTEGILRYYYHYDYQNITILELTEEVETLEIPLEIEGAPVTYIGGSHAGKSYTIEDKKLKKVHIPHSVIGLNYAFYKCPAIEDIFVENCDKVFTRLDYNNFQSSPQKKNVYVADFMYDDYKEYYTNYQKNEFWMTVKKANTIYWYNFEGSPNKGVYCIDYVNSSEKLINPFYNPKREGYIFTGWYQDQECTEIWDFESNVVSEIINLYAGWEKISE